MLLFYIEKNDSQHKHYRNTMYTQIYFTVKTDRNTVADFQTLRRGNLLLSFPQLNYIIACCQI